LILFLLCSQSSIAQYTLIGDETWGTGGLSIPCAALLLNPEMLLIQLLLLPYFAFK